MPNAQPDQPVRLVVPTGNTSEVKSAEFSPDGKYAATIPLLDSGVHIWDLHSGKLLCTLDGHVDQVIDGHFSPNGNHFVTVSSDKTAKLWDFRQGIVVQEFRGHNDHVRKAIFSPACEADKAGGKYLLTYSRDNSISVWISATGEQIGYKKANLDNYLNCQFGPDGKTLILAYHSPSGQPYAIWGTAVEIWDLASWKIVSSVTVESSSHFRQVACRKPRLANSQEGGRVYLFFTESISILESTKGRWLESVPITCKWEADAFVDGEGNILAPITTDGDPGLKLWSSEKGSRLVSLEDSHRSKGFFSFVHFSPVTPEDPAGGRYTLTPSSGPKAVHLHDTVSGSLIHRFKEQTGPASFSHDGEQVMTAASDFNVNIWNTRSGKLLQTLQGQTQRIKSVSFSPNQGVYIYYDDDSFRIWDMRTGEIKRSLKNHKSPVPGANSTSPDGKKFIHTNANPDEAVVRNAETQEILFALKGHTDCVHTAQFSPVCEEDPLGGRFIVTASCDSTAKVWDGTSGEMILTLEGHSYCVESAQFSPNAKQVLTVSKDRTARIWNAHNGKLLRTIVISSAYIAVDAGWTQLLSFHDSWILLHDMITGEKLLSWVVIGDQDWVVVHPSGLFDASPGAMKELYWVEGINVVDSEVFVKRYHEPGLWRRAVEREKLREVWM